MALCPACATQWGQAPRGQVSECVVCRTGSSDASLLPRPEAGPMTARIAADLNGLTSSFASMSEAMRRAGLSVAEAAAAFRPPTTIVASGAFMAPSDGADGVILTPPGSFVGGGGAGNYGGYSPAYAPYVVVTGGGGGGGSASEGISGGDGGAGGAGGGVIWANDAARLCVCGHRESNHVLRCAACGCESFVLREAADLLESGAEYQYDPVMSEVRRNDTGARISFRDVRNAVSRRDRLAAADTATRKFDPPPVRRPLALGGLLRGKDK